MYKAIKEIGEYKVGEEVPEEKAIAWLKMYAVPHVEKIGEDEETNTETPEEKSSGDVMLDDYLGRNTNVVKSSIEEDDLSKEQLEKLLELEKSDKKRNKVIKSINLKLRTLGEQ